MPSANFCAVLGGFPRSRRSDHKGRGRQRCSSPEVSSTAVSAQPPDLRSAHLTDVDFAVECLLVRRSRLLSGFCSARAFAPCFFRTQSRDCSPGASLPFTLHQVGRGLSSPSCRTCSALTPGTGDNVTCSCTFYLWAACLPLTGETGAILRRRERVLLQRAF